MTKKKTAVKKPAKKTQQAVRRSALPKDGFHDASLYYGDCFDVMKKWVESGQCEVADLIYLDPPFNSKAHYNILFGTGNGQPAQVIAFEDTWTWNEAAQERLDNLKRPPYSSEVIETINGLHAILGECGMLSYLTYMAERLHYCRLMLKSSGGIYLHCDPTASHYLKILMDAIFGRRNFQNEIVWWYSWGLHTPKQWNKKHDIILYYAKDANQIFFDGAQVRVPYRPGSGMTTDPRWNKKYNPAGKLPEDVFDIPTINGMSKERIGYPTQKPLALLDRIIKGSTKQGDFVLDPFCGCGTTAVAAHKLKRRWCGIDLSAFPVELIRARLHDIRDLIHVDGIPRDMKGARLLAKKPFEFEKWAIMSIPGMLPNTKQTSDGAVDGRGWLENDISGAVKPPASKSPMVIAQVTKSPSTDLNKIRALHSSMMEKKALFGIYITLERLSLTPSIQKIITTAGSVKKGANQYPCLQLYSVADFFDGKKPDLPPLATLRVLARGASRTSIKQERFDYEEKL